MIEICINRSLWLVTLDKWVLTTSGVDDMTKKIQNSAVQTVFSFGGTINPPTTKFSGSKGTFAGTAATLDF